MGASGTFLVGEEGPEVMEVSPAGVTIKPLSGGFAAGGGVSFDPQSMYAALSPLYASLGLNAIPLMGRGPRGTMTVRGWGGGTPNLTGKSFLDTMGIQPNLVRDRSTGATYYIDDGQIRGIHSSKEFEEMGFNWGDVWNLNPSTIAEYGWERGPRMRERPDMSFAPPNPFARSATPAVDPTTGAILPAPFRIAAERRRLASVDPTLHALGSYAYDYPGSPVPQSALRTAEDIYNPRGSSRGFLGLR